MAHKKVNNADAGTLTKHGGNDLDKWSDWASGVDTDDYDIASDFSVRSGKRKLRNPANTFDYIETAGAITGNRIVNEPVLVGTDTRVYQDHNQTIINKTASMDANFFAANWTGYDYVIYRSGTDTKCRDLSTGTTVSQNASPDVVIQFALDNGIRKDIYIAQGTYSIAAVDLMFSFPETRLKLNPGAIITVPNGYTGHLWNLTRVNADTTSLSNIIIDGGRYVEAGTPANNWDCLYINNTNPDITGSTAIFFCKFMNMYIRNAGNGIHLRSAGGRGWINGNMFQNLVIDNQQCGILFDYTGSVTSANGANRNHFLNCIMQCNANSTVGGVIDISGESNKFDDLKVWDCIAGSTSCNIHPRAIDTIIDGGIFMTNNFTDMGVRSRYVETTVNRMYPYLAYPSYKAHGLFQGTGWDSAHWSGILKSMTPVAGHTQTAIAGSAANGRGVRVSTPASANTAAGWKSTDYVTMRDWVPRLKARFKLTSATAVRMFIGFKAAASDLTGDNYLLANDGFGVGIDSTLTNFRLLRNDAAGNTITASTGVAVDTALREIEIWYDAASPMQKWNYKMQVPGSIAAIDNTKGAFYDTDVPALGTELRVVCQVGTTAATAKGIDLFYFEVSSDK